MVGFELGDLYRSPVVNPINQKARSIPILNPVNIYGRVFFFSWFGFMVAFWAWYAFPPLLTVTIKEDLGLTSAQVANSNIVSTVATFILRFFSGPLCDHFGPRKVFGVMLLAGAIPTGLAPLVKDATGLYVVRFFMGILGSSFVPCQVWTTAFFDKNVVGSANALTGGLGNAGGGVTYFIMPAVFDSLVKSGGYSRGVAWRLSFLVPLAAVVATGAALLWLCPDTPDGAWVDRHAHARQHLAEHQLAEASSPGATGAEPHATDAENTAVATKEELAGDNAGGNGENNGADEPPVSNVREPVAGGRGHSQEAHLSSAEMVQTVRGEIVQSPKMAEILTVTFSLPTWALMLTYMCSFGAELAINAILSSYYLYNFPNLGQSGATRWAAMFGFLNLVTRPVGGAVADGLYRTRGRGPNLVRQYGKTDHGLWFKRHWITMCGILGGGALVLVGKVVGDPDATYRPSEATTFGLIALAAIFLEAGNGANFALVPHVHPYANGIVSGLTGAAGNLGGIIFSVIFRFVTHKLAPDGDAEPDYGKSFWIVGVIHIVINAAASWVEPIPKNQIGGR